MHDGVWGLIGALIGALVAGGLTIWVARWQAKEQLRLSRLDKLDALVLELQVMMFSLAEVMADRRHEEAFDPFRFVDLCSAIRARASGETPHFAGQVEVGAKEVARAYTERPTRSAGGGYGIIVRTSDWKAGVSDAAMGLYDLCMKWLSSPEKVEKEKPPFGSLQRRRATLREGSQ